MRIIGQTECLSATVERVSNRTVFVKVVAPITFFSTLEKHGKDPPCRLLVQKQLIAWTLLEIRILKHGSYYPWSNICTSNLQEVVDMCMQIMGKGFSQDVPLFPAFVATRTLRMADGPDEVHWRTAATWDADTAKVH